MNNKKMASSFAEGCVPGPVLSICCVNSLHSFNDSVMSPDLQTRKLRHREDK
jgi:hypothetical protein